MVDVVESAVYKAEAVGAESFENLFDALLDVNSANIKVAQSTSALSTASGNLAASQNRTTVSVTNVGRAVRGTADQLEKIITSADKVALANAKLANSLEKIKRLQDEGSGTPEESERVRLAIAAVNKQYDDQIRIIERSNRVANDNKTAVKNTIAANNDNAASIVRTNRAHTDSQQQMKKSEVSAGQLRYATQNLTFQLNDVATSLASGAPPARVFAQQMGQIIQVFQQGGGVSMVMSNFAKQVASFVTPGRLMVASLAGIAVGIGVVINRMENLRQATHDFQTALGPIASEENVAGIQKISTELQKMGQSFTTANAQAAILARNPIIVPQEASRIARVGGDVAARLGDPTDVKKGIQELVTAFEGGVESAVKFGTSIRALDDIEASNLLTMTRHKGVTATLAEVFKLMETNLAGARDKALTPFQKKMEELTAAWNNLLNTLANSQWFQSFHDIMIKAIKDLDDYLNRADQIQAVPVPSVSVKTPDGKAAKTPEEWFLGLPGVQDALKVYRSIFSGGAMPNLGGYNNQGRWVPGPDSSSFVGPPPYEQTFGTGLSLSQGASAGLGRPGVTYFTPEGLDKLQRSEGSPSQIHYPDEFGMPGGVAKQTGLPSSASGAFGFITETWRKYAQQAGVDIKKFPYAYQAPLGVQRAVAAITPASNWTGTDSQGRPFNATAQAIAADPRNVTGTPFQANPADIARVNKAYDDLKTSIADTNKEAAKFGPQAQAQAAFTAEWNRVVNAAGAGESEAAVQTRAWEQAMTAYNGVLTKASIEQGKYNTESNLAAEMGRKTTEAYTKGVVPGLQAAAEEQATIANLLDSSVNKELRKNQILRAGAIEATKAAAQSNAQAAIQISHEEQIAKAAGLGTAQLHDKQVEMDAITKTQDVYNKALATGDTQLIAIAKAEQETAIAQAKRLDSLKQTTAAQAEANKNIDQTEILQKEIELQGKTSEEIQYQISLLQIRQRLQNEFNNASPEARKRFEDTATAMAKVNLELARAQREQARIDDFFKQIGDTIDKNITQNLIDAFNGKKVTDFATQIKTAFTSLIPQIISSLIVRPIIGSALSSFGLTNAASSFGTVGGTIGAIGNLAGGAVGGTSTPGGGGSGSLSTLFQGGGLLKDIFGGGSGSGGGLFSKAGDFLNNTIGANIGFTPTGPLAQYGGLTAAELSDLGLSAPAGALIPSSLGATLGGIGAGFTAGSLLNSVVGGNQVGGTVGSGVGSIAGALIGSFTPLGPLGGALIGGLAGGGLGGLFGSNRKPDQASGGVINLGTGRISNVQSGGNAQNDQTASQIGTALAAAVTRALAIPGAQLPGGAVSVQAGSRDGIKLSYGGRDYKFADASSAITAGLIAIRDNLTGVSDVVHTVLASISDPSQIEEALGFAATYEKINDQFQKSFADVEKDTNVMGPFALAMQQINGIFQQLTDEANKFGLSLDPINGALAEATKRLQGDFMKALNEAFNSASQQDFLNQLEAVAKARDQLYTEGEAIGISRESIAPKVNSIAAGQANEILKQLTEDQLKVVVDAMRSTRPEWADMAQSLIDTAKAADSAAKALAEVNLELQRQAFAYSAQQGFDVASGKEFLAQLRDFDKGTKDLLAQLKPLNFAEDSYQAQIIKETQHKASLTVLTGLNNDQLELSRQLLEQLNPSFAAWVDEAKNMIQATKDAEENVKALAAAEQRHNDILQAGLAIRQYLNQQETSAGFTSPQSRLTAARSQYQQQLGLAQGGDVQALQGITQVADTLKQALLGFYASGQQGMTEWEQVKASLAALPGVPSASGGAVNPVVDAVTTAGNATVDAINNATDAGTDAIAVSSRAFIQATIEANNNVVNTAISTSGSIVESATKNSTDIVASAIITGGNIVDQAIKSSNEISGATTAGFKENITATLLGNDTIIKAANENVATVTTNDNFNTTSLLDSNAANATVLLNGNLDNANALIGNNNTNSTALLAANEAQTSALIQSTVDSAVALTTVNNDNTNALIDKNDQVMNGLIEDATAQTAASVANANVNTNALVSSTSASTNAITAKHDEVSQQMRDAALTNSNSIIAQGAAAVVANAATAQAVTDQSITNANTNTTNAVNAAYASTDILGGRTEAASKNVADVTKTQTDAMIAQGASQLAAMQALSGTSVGETAIATAVYNTGAGIMATTAAWSNAIFGQIAAYSGWIVQSNADWTNAAIGSQVGWDNAIVNNIAAWGNAINSTVGWAGNAIIGTMVPWYDSIRYTIWAGLDATWRNVEAWGNATVQTIREWGINTTNGIGYWGNADVTAQGAVGGGLFNQMRDTANSIINMIASASVNIIGAIGGVSGGIIAQVGAVSNNDIAAIYTAANSIVASTTVTSNNVAAVNNATNYWGENNYNATIWARDAANGVSGTVAAWGNAMNGSIGAWGQNVYNIISGMNSNMVSWFQSLYNITDAVNGNVGWLRGIYDELHLIREYMDLLTNVTIQFDEFMAAYYKADRGSLEAIERQLRKNAFG